jgi:hypothetical protein
MDMHDQNSWFLFWTANWWLGIVAIWFLFGFVGMVLRHMRHRDMIKLIQNYAAQGKEPPQALMTALSQPTTWRGDPATGASYRYGYYRTMRRGVLCVALATAFGVLAFLMSTGKLVHEHGSTDPTGFTMAAIILGLLGAAFLLAAAFHPERRNNLNKP